MNGAEGLVRTLLGAGITTCFANPGTSEMHFVAALDRVPGMRCILGLFEGVATGAADGYARMTGAPAATLLHCGPGLANGLANLHNARRADTPILNLIGDQATYHRPLEAPLTADTEGWARPVSTWARTCRTVDEVSPLAAEAIAAACRPPGGIASLILPSDVCWNEGGTVADPQPRPAPRPLAPGAIDDIARLLHAGEQVALLIGGHALRAEPLELAHAIAEHTGARLMAPMFNGRIERGRGRFAVPKIPYNIDLALSALDGVRHVVLIGSRPPVTFFAYPGKRGRIEPPDAKLHVLAEPGQDAVAALRGLADAVSASKPALPPQTAPELVTDAAISPETVTAVIAALLPEHAIVVDESLTFGRNFYPGTAAAAPHDWLQLTGGAIGCGPPLATGAAIACPERRVVNLQADGSALYTVQALWTQARSKCPVTTVILSNRKYAILLGELVNVGARPGPAARDLFGLDRPDIDWVALANGFGVPAARAETLRSFADLFVTANREPGPFLIELVI